MLKNINFLQKCFWANVTSFLTVFATEIMSDVLKDIFRKCYIFWFCITFFTLNLRCKLHGKWWVSKSAGRVMSRLYFPDPDPQRNGECLDCTSKNNHHSEQNAPSATDLIYEMTFAIERSHSTIPAGKLIERTNDVFSPCRLQGGESSCVPLNTVESSVIGIVIVAWFHRDWIRKSPIWWPGIHSTDPNATRSLDV